MLRSLHAAAVVIFLSAAPAADAALLGGSPQLDFRRVVREAKAKVFPAVVYIRCVREATEEGRKGSAQVSGSGVIVSPRGEVLTNWHVVDRAVSVRCLLSDGRPMNATIVGTDKDTDLALLALELPAGGETLPFADIGRSDGLIEGDFVMAMGAPFGLNRSVSIGIISCARRYLPDISEYSLWLQTDAAINPGNSGGPLVNTEGEVIGLNTRGVQMAEDMGFAIPSETILVLLPQLRDSGRVAWSWTGLQLQPLNDFNRNIYFDQTEGVIIAQTDPESPARRAGIEPRDRLIAIDGDPITALTEEDLPDIRQRLGLLELDRPAVLRVVRNGEPLELALTPREKGEVEGAEQVCERWDLTVKAINQFDNPQLHFYRREGVFVYGVKMPGNAANAGLGSGDIILRIGDEEVTTLDDVRRIYDESVEALDQRHRLIFVVLRDGLMRQMVLDYARDYRKR